MYRRILVPLDGSELAESVLRFVRVLAKPQDSEISLLRVIEHTPPDINPELNPVMYAHRTLEHRMQRAHEYLTTLADGLRPKVSRSRRRSVRAALLRPSWRSRRWNRTR